MEMSRDSSGKRFNAADARVVRENKKEIKNEIKRRRSGVLINVK